MRQLHSVAYHERFAASGTYIQEQNGEPDGITEAWTIHTLPDQSRRIRVDHDERNAESKATILLEALADTSGSIQRFDLRFETPGGNSLQVFRTNYTIFSDHVQIGRQLDDQPLEDEVIPLAPNTVIFPLFYVFIGSVIKQIVAQGGTDIPVFLPKIITQGTNTVLSGIIEPRSVIVIDTKHYHFGDRRNAQPGIYQLDETGLLTTYAINSMRVILKNLARSNTFAS